jgi:hypothetical protein
VINAAVRAQAQLRDAMPFLGHAPIRFVSAKTGKRVHDVLSTATDLARRHFQRISTSQVNKVLQVLQVLKVNKVLLVLKVLSVLKDLELLLTLHMFIMSLKMDALKLQVLLEAYLTLLLL